MSGSHIKVIYEQYYPGIQDALSTQYGLYGWQTEWVQLPCQQSSLILQGLPGYSFTDVSGTVQLVKVSALLKLGLQ